MDKMNEEDRQRMESLESSLRFQAPEAQPVVVGETLDGLIYTETYRTEEFTVFWSGGYCLDYVRSRTNKFSMRQSSTLTPPEIEGDENGN